MKTITRTLIIIDSFLLLGIIIIFFLSFKQKKVAGTNIFVSPISSTTILSTGDLMLGRSVNFKGYNQKDFFWSMREISPFIKQFDYSIANLETPIIENCPLVNDGMIFCASQEVGQSLHNSGLDLLTLANNHTGNYGVDGLNSTQTILKSNNLESLKEGKFFSKTINGQIFGFLAYDDISHTLDFEKFTVEIQHYSQLVDNLLISLHFGQEYSYLPNDRQKKLAHLAIESGGDIVLGNHSHWIGPIELYQNGAIIYSHGNFVFDQMWSEETRQGVATAWTFKSNKLKKIEIYPIYITQYGKANLERNTKVGQTILKKMQDISHLGTFEDDHLTINLE